MAYLFILALIVRLVEGLTVVLEVFGVASISVLAAPFISGCLLLVFVIVVIASSLNVVRSAILAFISLLWGVVPFVRRIVIIANVFVGGAPIPTMVCGRNYSPIIMNHVKKYIFATVFDILYLVSVISVNTRIATIIFVGDCVSPVINVLVIAIGITPPRALNDVGWE